MIRSATAEMKYVSDPDHLALLIRLDRQEI